MRILMLLLLWCFVMPANADMYYGKIVGFIPYVTAGREILIFKVDGGPSGGCNTTARFSLDSTFPYYKTTVAALIAAFHAQSDVAVSYAQTCNVWSNAWDANYMCTGAASC